MPDTNSIDSLLTGSPYGMAPEEKDPLLFQALRAQVVSAAARHEGYRNFVEQSPTLLSEATSIADLPYLPVRIFKTDPPLSLVPDDQIKRVMSSSATTGQMPSRIALDSVTSRRMSRGTSGIISNYIGKERRPYLVVDVPDSAKAVNGGMGARGAAIRGLQPFAKEMIFCLRENSLGELELDREIIEEFSDKYRDESVLVYGFTYLLWLYLVTPLAKDNASLNLPNAYVLHSGGWKRLSEQAVEKPAFNTLTGKVLGIGPDRVLDFYGMVENLGVVYPDCPEGNKHVPSFGEIVIRSPLTLQPVEIGEVGIIQTCSVIPESFPGHLLLTEDLARVVANDGCGCGRRGTVFQFAGRIPKAEVRGCGNVKARR